MLSTFCHRNVKILNYTISDGVAVAETCGYLTISDCVAVAETYGCLWVTPMKLLDKMPPLLHPQLSFTTNFQIGCPPPYRDTVDAWGYSPACALTTPPPPHPLHFCMPLLCS